MEISVKYIVGGVIKEEYGCETEDYTLLCDSQNGRTTICLKSKNPIELIGAKIEENYEFESGSRLFLNGYQSWTETREYGLSETVHNINRLPKVIKDRFHFEAYGDAWFYRYGKDRFHGFTYAYAKKKDGRTELIGSLNEANAYLIIHYDKLENKVMLKSDCMYKQVDGEFTLFDFVRYEGEAKDVLKRYFDHFGPCNVPKVRGYTSWYLHYQDINEEKMLKALEGIDSENFDLFQIDDGYETFVGDWMEIDEKKFPNGLKGIVDKIHAKGLKAGIWLAPFVCETKSRIYKEHPDWLYRKDGKVVFAGSNWSGDVALDLRNPEVQDYIKKCLEFYIDMGFDFFKLDFLYAAALCAGRGGTDISLEDSEHRKHAATRAEIMHQAMVCLREILKDKLILGCGVPLSSAFNLVDYCRIGPDVSLIFDDVFYMRAMHRERISTKTTLLNTIFRSVMDGHVFRNDPDVFLLRDENIKLSKEQRRALTMINHLCGSVFMTSDNVADYDESKKAVLKEAQKLTRANINNIFTDGRIVHVEYTLDGEPGELKYDSKNGVLI